MIKKKSCKHQADRDGKGPLLCEVCQMTSPLTWKPDFWTAGAFIHVELKAYMAEACCTLHSFYAVITKYKDLLLTCYKE